jgi:3-methyladenine DNA glycosylase AlkD
VSLFYYSSHRRRQPSFQKVITLLDRQMEFDHYYVQKGVGWTLREAGNVYPKETFQFLEANIHRVSSHAFTAATEKISPTQKSRLKQLRKVN